MEPIEGSETSAFKTHTPGKYPKENKLHFKMFFFLNIKIGFSYRQQLQNVPGIRWCNLQILLL